MTRMLLSLLLVAGFCLAARGESPTEVAAWLRPQTWIKDAPGPVVTLGMAGEFDDQHIFAPAVVEEGGRFWMWYSGSQGSPGNRVFRLGFLLRVGCSFA